MSSSFAAKLGTNYCPQDEELVQIKELLIEPCQRLKHLDDEIAAMQRTLDKLAEERGTLSAYVNAHRALMSPIRRLPLDLIEEIFVACIPTHRNCVMSAEEAPVLLGRICSLWRAISLSTPRLWCTLHIVEPTRPYNPAPGLYDAKVAQRLEIANTWLQRSGKCPLSISLESNLDHGITPPLTPSPSPPSTYLFMDVLMPYASRWKHLHLVIPSTALETLSHLAEADVPLLQSLKIVQRPHQPHNNAHSALSQSGILHAPNLTQFSFLGSNINSSDLPLRWEQLITLSLVGSVWGMGHAQTSQVALSILSRCPKLRACKLLVHDPSEEPVADAIVECPFMHTFELQCVGSPLHTSARLLNRLSLPNLRDLKLRGPEEPNGTTPADALLSSIAASTRLESISIDSDTFSRSSLIDFLGHLPLTLRRIHITEPSHMWRPSLADGALDDEVFAALDASPDGSRPCPVLEELIIHNCRKLSDEALLRFARERTPTLRLVNVRFDRERQTDILPTLLSFSGMRATLTYLTLAPPTFSPWQGLRDAPSQTAAPWMLSPPVVPFYPP
ncbi:hypothetical protein DFH06DRAFT_433882 [Mycena polygramma]|nr:hypothetical protein DFH06DRAFT_433882 [Mycena polygramma]